MEKKKGLAGKIIKGILFLFCGILIAVFSLLSFAAKWAGNTWANLEMEEIVYHLSGNLEGTGGGMIEKFIINCVVPLVIIILAYVVILVLLRKRRNFRCGFAIILLISSMFCCVVFAGRYLMDIGLVEYIRAQNSNSEFIKNYYVDPADAMIEFPEEKRNLIMIFMESTEITFADKANGGAFDENIIPELTKLAQENEDFSGDSSQLNGAYVMPYTSWTMAAIFAHTSGLPMQTSIKDNNLDTQDTFFPNTIVLGDILEAEGYNQTFMLGSEASFGGRALYFSTHGNYAIKDYMYAQENGWIEDGYYVNWGFEDEILFENAKKELLELSSMDQPFNLTLLTVDTHFEDGYICDLCEEQYEEQYANVYACASRQVNDFVSWIQKQDFYENTAIVIVGDHYTMDADFCDDVDEDYDRRIYVNYINAACDTEDSSQYRIYTTFDTFPTTLAALGVSIEGNRLGLGANLFSTEKTLAERYDCDYLSNEIKIHSDFMEELEGVNANDKEYLSREGLYPDATVESWYDEENSVLNVYAYNFKNVDFSTDTVDVTLEYDDGITDSVAMNMDEQDESIVCSAEIVINENRNLQHIYVVVNSADGDPCQVTMLPTELGLITDDLTGYLTEAQKLDDCIIMISAKDECTTSLTEEMQSALSSLGIQTNLMDPELFRCTFYAVISPDGTVKEDVGMETTRLYGTMPDGETTYYICSIGHNAIPTSTIKIGSDNYSINRRGLNIVLFDTKKMELIDSVCFDTYDISNGSSR